MPPNYLRAFERGSSPVDWCEQNYVITPLIAEFVNTISSIPFLIFPIVQWHLCKSNAYSSHQSLKIIWFLNSIVGISSAYFHATLSLAGQLLDELSILWLVTAGFCLWTPKRFLLMLPGWTADKKTFQTIVIILCIVGSLLCLIEPAVNAFVLMVFGLPITIAFVSEMKRCSNARVLHLCYRVCTVWFVALFCWLTDRLFCDLWTKISFPYMHAAWHILMAITAYTVCVIFAYFNSFNESPQAPPELKYWPSNRFELAVPYISLDVIPSKWQ